MLSILLMILSITSCSKVGSFKSKVKYHHEEGIIKGIDGQSREEYLDGIEKLIEDLIEQKKLGSEFNYGITTDRGVETIKVSFPMLLMLGFKEDMPYDDCEIKDSNGNVTKRKGRDSIFIDLIKYMVDKSRRHSLEGNYIDINKRYVGIPLLDFIVAKYSNRILNAFLKQTYLFANFVEAVDNVLILAIAKGDRERLEKLLYYMHKRDEETGEGIIDKFASVPDELAFAISNKDIELAKLLVDYGFDLNKLTVRGYKVSDYCGVNACEDGMRYCLAKGAKYRDDTSVILDEVKVVTFGGMLTAIGITSEVIGDMHGIFVLSLVGDAMVSKITEFFGLSIDLDLIKLINKNYNLVRKRGEWALDIDFDCEYECDKRIILLQKLKSMIDTLNSKDPLLSDNTKEDLKKLSKDMKKYIKNIKRKIGKEDYDGGALLNKCNEFKGRYKLIFADVKENRRDNIAVKGKRGGSKVEKRIKKSIKKKPIRNSLSFKNKGDYVITTVHEVPYLGFTELYNANKVIGMLPPTPEQILHLSLPSDEKSIYWSGKTNILGSPTVFGFKEDERSYFTDKASHSQDKHLCLFVRKRGQ